MAKSKLIITDNNQILIQSNYRPRTLEYGYQLSEKEKAEFDYIDPEDFDMHDFLRYKGRVYDAGEFMQVQPNSPFYPYWHGQYNDSYFSGILMRIDPDDSDRVIVGTFYA